MNLTRRQETFMRQLLELYTEFQEPIHYSALADRIGVSRITAYDMLRVLEEKGYVASVYQLASGRTGPGRTTVLYHPTEKAKQAIIQLASEANVSDWETLSDDIILRMRTNAEMDEELASVTRIILERLPPEGPPEVRYCTELISIMVLRLRHSPLRDKFCRYIPYILGDPDLTSPEGLMLLAGSAFAMVVSEDESLEWNRELLAHVKRYYHLVARMSEEYRLQLAENLRFLLPTLCEDESNH